MNKSSGIPKPLVTALRKAGPAVSKWVRKGAGQSRLAK